MVLIITIQNLYQEKKIWFYRIPGAKTYKNTNFVRNFLLNEIEMITMNYSLIVFYSHFFSD